MNRSILFAQQDDLRVNHKCSSASKNSSVVYFGRFFFCTLCFSRDVCTTDEKREQKPVCVGRKATVLLQLLTRVDLLHSAFVWKNRVEPANGDAVGVTAAHE